MGRSLTLCVVLTCAIISFAYANRRTCFCSYKICDRNNRCVTGDAYNQRYSGFLLGCSSTRRKCSNDCPNHVRAALCNPHNTDTGRTSVCNKFPHTTDNQGVRVVAIRKASSCTGHIESDVVSHNRICCDRTCTCNLVSRKRVGSQFEVENLNVYLPNPSVPNHYDCRRRLTDLCEDDCKAQLRHSNSLRSPSINSYSGQKICSSLGGRKVASPGFTASVDYDIGDRHDHHFDLAGGNVCCGCTCQLSYTYGGTKTLINVEVPQTAAKKYFNCNQQAAQCNSICRESAHNALGSATATTVEDTLGFKVCKAIGLNLPNAPGLTLYSEYDYGSGYKKTVMDRFCCFKAPFPPFFFSYNC